MADMIRPFLGQQVLEIGAGTGNLTDFLSRGRAQYIASDIEPEHLSRLRARFQDRPNVSVCSVDATDMREIPGICGSMDSIVCLNVLEHIADDTAALRNMSSALKPGGTIAILVPHGPEVFGTLDRALGHVRRYRSGEAETRLEEAGFTVLQAFGFNRISRPAWFVAGRLLRQTSLDGWPLKLFDRTVWLWRGIDRALPWPPNSMIAVARKP
jgi:SAM-dependent methyltransferase